MLNNELHSEIEKLDVANTPFCVVTIVDGRGSIPQIIGAKAIFTNDGLHFGTVGGGRLEVKCQEKVSELLAAGHTVKNAFARWNIQKDINMTCGGEVALYFEVYRPEADWNIVVFGAGHVSQQLCGLLADLDCRLLCVDTRRDWLDKLPASDGLETLLVEDYVDGVTRIPLNATIIIMTAGHASDVAILKRVEARDLDPAYIGVIGSASKSRILRRELRDAGASPAFIDAITCPIGEQFGDNTPPEISISIVSQLLKSR